MAIAIASTEDFGPHSVLRVLTLNGVDLASVAANTTAEQDLTVAGLLTTDAPLALIMPAAVAGIGVVNVRVKAANTLAVTLVNSTAAPVDAASADGYKLVLLRG